ncbi:MAG TPA: histidine kinase dimerization/phospho-acceptor domain-containing protein [Stellaceae bacterium]|nr:histidine kinase dimerization/phospho-acceptor domain-containing protein [Stellaceae bacterium]
MFLTRLLRTASFRLAALYLLLFGASVLVLDTVVFWQTSAALDRQVESRIEAETALLQEAFRTGGLDRLVATMQGRGRVARNFAYLVVDPAGRRLGGDLPPAFDRLGPGWVESDADEDDDKDKDKGGEHEHKDRERVRALVTRLAGGLRLSVGRDLDQIGEAKRMLLGTLASGFGMVLLLGLGGGLLLSAGFLRRVDAITRTADAIIAGDLSRRIERTGSGDDFDRLSATLNAMLDRISGLMDNLRQVSNDIAHDLRTPLSRLQQGLEEARGRELTAEDYKGVVERAMAEADGLLEIFSALLRIAQIEAGARRAAFRRVDLSEIMRTIAEAYEPAAEEGGRSLRRELQTGSRSRAIAISWRSSLPISSRTRSPTPRRKRW